MKIHPSPSVIGRRPDAVVRSEDGTRFDVLVKPGRAAATTADRRSRDDRAHGFAELGLFGATLSDRPYGGPSRSARGPSPETVIHEAGPARVDLRTVVRDDVGVPNRALSRPSDSERPPASSNVCKLTSDDATADLASPQTSVVEPENIPSEPRADVSCDHLPPSPSLASSKPTRRPASAILTTFVEAGGVQIVARAGLDTAEAAEFHRRAATVAAEFDLSLEMFSLNGEPTQNTPSPGVRSPSWR